MRKIVSKLKMSIIPSLAGAFTFFGFGIAELYISNREEFWFSYLDIFPTILFWGILSVFICSGMVLIIPNKYYKCSVAVLYGIALGLYVQGNFLPNDYGQLDGTAIDWGLYQGRFVLNTIVWCAIILGAVLLVWKFKDKALDGFKVLCGIIFATQVVTLVIIGITLPKERTDDSILSTKGQLEVSENNNTFVFILDAFDAELFCELLEKYPLEIKDIFTDFTFYRDTVGGATRTRYAIPYILSGQAKKEKGSYVDYLVDSMDESDLFNELKKAKYDVGLYTESAYVDMNRSDVIDNIVNEKPRPSSTVGLTRDFLKLTAFRYVPHALKQYFWLYSGDFDKWKGSVEGNVEAYVFDDVSFYDKVSMEGVKCTTSKDVFRFYHLEGVHEPYTMNENCERLENEQGSEESQALGVLRIVKEFIQKIKEAGVYDNATIFIMADHGLRGIEQNPLFMVKQSGEQFEFQQSDISISYKDVPSMFVDSLTQGHIEIEKYRCTGERYFYSADANNDIVEYITQGAAYDVESFSLTGNIYSGYAEQTSYEYQLGEELSFGKEATANTYCLSGFSVNEGAYTWTLGNTSEMYFEIVGDYDDLLVEFECGVYNLEQHVKVYANDNIVSDIVLADNGNYDVSIPNDCVNEGILKLKFELPDAISPKEIGESGDTREVALAMQSIVITSISEEKN